MQYVPHFTTFQVGNHFPTPLSFDRKYSNLFYKMWWTSFFFLWLWVLTKTTYIPEIKIYHETCDIWNCVRLPRILCYLFACTYMLVLVLRCQRIKHNHYHWRFLFFLSVSWAWNHICSNKVVKVSYKFYFKFHFKYIHLFFCPIMK